MRRGTRIANAYMDVTVDGDGINEGIVDGVEGAGPGVERAGKDHGERYSNGFSEGFTERLRSKFGKKVSGKLIEFLDGEGIGNAVGSDMVQGLRKRLAEGHDDIRYLFDRMLAADADGKDPAIVANFTHAIRSATNEVTLLERELRSAMEAEGLLNKAVSRNSAIGGAGGGRGRDRGLGDIVGRLFGGGSRNNFLNLFGNTLGGIVNLIDKAATGIGGFFGKFITGFQAVSKEAGIFQRILGGFAGLGGGAGGMLASIAKAGPAAAIAITAVTVALSVMASVVGALLGIVTALASTIASALVGSLLILGGALAAVTAAGGLLTAAFMSMTDAQHKLLMTAFKPLKAEMVGIGQIMLQDMVPAFQTWSKNLQEALMLAVPVAQVMGAAFAQAGNIITQSLSGPGFQMFAQALTTYLPSIVTSLASALGSFLNGLMAVFAALMPYVLQFANYLQRVALTFSNWATSAAGQNAISDFVARAVTSIQSLWNFLTSFGGFLTKLLFSPEAMTAGNTIFDSMAKTFDKFTKKIAKAQANGDLKKWFDDAIQFGGQLWGVIEALGGTFAALYNSGVIEGIGRGLEFLADVIRVLNKLVGPMVDQWGNFLPKALAIVIGPITNVANAIIGVVNVIDAALQKIGIAVRGAQEGAAAFSAAQSVINGTINRQGYGDDHRTPMSSSSSMPSFNMPQVQQMGTDSLNATSVDRGGYKKPKKWHNPWKKWAESLIKDGPGVKQQMAKAIRALNKAAVDGIREGARAASVGDLQSGLNEMMSSLREGGTSLVETAQQSLNSAASELAGATTRNAAQKALRKVRAAQKAMRVALTEQKSINLLNAQLAKHKVVHNDIVDKMLKGAAYKNASLADYAKARAIVAQRLEAANEKLADAISMRDDYKNQVTDSLKAFGSLSNIQGQTVDGVEQALTSGDITSTLQTRLDKMREFQSDLQLLIAQGLSNDAYKQIVDQGVEGGGALADALLAGGSAAIQETNSLVSQINGVATNLGIETSNRLYQAGVSAAQGLVDGLTSLSAQLDAASIKLGEAIAKNIAKALGIKSPSTVLRDMMGSVGDGAVLGLNDQQVKVGSAAAALANMIAVNPTATPRSTTSSEDAVSGNSQRPIELTVVTPTKDPKAAGIEAVNELVGRLT